MQRVGDDVVLGAALHDCYRHLRGSQQRAYLAEPIVAQPHQVFKCLVDGVHAFLSGSMARLSVGIAVDDHQPLLGDGRLHAGGLSHDSHIDRRQLRHHSAEAVLARHLLLSCRHPENVEVPLAVEQDAVGLERCHQTAATVVGA